MSAKVSSNGTIFLCNVGDTIQNCAVQSWNWKTDPVNTAEVKDESGNAIERRRDDNTTKASVKVKYRAAYSIPQIGDILSFRSQSWEIEGVGGEEIGGQHRMLTLEVMNSQYITPSSTSVTTT